MPQEPKQHVAHWSLAHLRANAAYERFTRRTELPMLVLSVVFLVVLVVPALDARLSRTWMTVFARAEVVIWVVFGVEYLTRFALAPRRSQFVLHNIPDLVAIAVPVLRPLRLARLLRFTRAGALVARSAQHGRVQLHLRVVVQVTGAAILVLFVGAVGMYDVERDAPGSNIHTFGDALWWALTTVTTVGYGDRYPVTTEGRLVAAGVMLTGIAVLGVVTASIASWFVENIQGIQQSEERQTVHEQRLEGALADIVQRLARLEERMGATNPGDSSGDAIPPARS